MPRNPKPGRIRCAFGFTLLEILISLILVSAMISGIGMVYRTGILTVHQQGIRMGSKGECARALVHLESELRQALSLTEADSDSLQLSLDSDDNGVEETIRYAWSGTAGDSLDRISESTTALVNSVSNLSFSYYDSGQKLLSFPVTPSEVRSIAIEMKASQADETMELRNRVRLRNLS